MVLDLVLVIGRKLIQRGHAGMQTISRAILPILIPSVNFPKRRFGNMVKKFILSVFFVFSFAVSQQLMACTISEDLTESVPLNYQGIPNAYRLKMMSMVLNARQWPNVEIQAQIVANAYVGEANAKELAESRGKLLKEFLIELGIKPQYIYVDSHLEKLPYPKDSTGRSGYLQLSVGLMPLCKGGCQRLCDDPRVTPTSKAIK
ncbi:hypothetical protein OKW29_002030 [Paraburkholderia sp. CI3]